MKEYYQKQIKKTKEKIAFFEELLKEEKQHLQFCENELKNCDINEKIENYKKKLLGEK